MTGKLDKKMGELAAKLISQFGKQIVYVQVSKPAYDPAMGKAVASEVKRAVDASIMDTNAYRDDLKVSADHLILMATTEVRIPTMRDRVEIDGETFTIVHKLPIYSGALIAAHKLFVKRQ